MGTIRMGRQVASRRRGLAIAGAWLLAALASTGTASAAFPGGLAEPQLESPPTVSNVTPDTSLVAGGVSVIIGGMNLAEATQVHFGSTSASFVVHSALKIEAVAPPGVEGNVDVTVTTPAGTSATSSRDRFSYVPPGPSVLEVSPDEGRVEGGKAIKVFGAHLSGTTEVHFGATSASFEADGEEALNVVTPEGVAPTEDIRVTTPEGTSAITPGDRYFYTAKVDQIHEVGPKQGPAAGGTSVGIAGENFYGITGVDFGSTPAPSFTVDSHGHVTAISPPGTAEETTVQLESTFGPSSPEWCVAKGDEGAACSIRDHYRYIDPTVTQITPDHGPLAGGTPFTLSGSGFGIGKTQTEILVGRTPATAVECTSLTSCTGTAPAAGKAKPAAIIVVIKSSKVTKSKKNKAVEFSYE